MSEEWKKIDPVRLLHKHGKIGMNDQSTTPDHVVDAIASSIDQPQEGDFKIPEDHRSEIVNQSFPKVKSRLIDTSPEAESERMIRKYTQQNGSIIVRDGESAIDAKKRLEKKDKPDKGLLLG